MNTETVYTVWHRDAERRRWIPGASFKRREWAEQEAAVLRDTHADVEVTPTRIADHGELVLTEPEEER